MLSYPDRLKLSFNTKGAVMAGIFVFFFVSGFCSILYELVWLRLAMAKFGVTTALVSVVLSVFMAGLGAGSWLAGALVRRYGDRIKFPPLRLYALSELLIGLSALVVPLQLAWGSRLLETVADRAPLSSGTYYLISGAWLAVTLIPWCACMGATIPLAMFAIRRLEGNASERSFSFLYLANVLGALVGACIPLFLIELYGFRGTLRIGAVLNLLIAVSAFALALAFAKPSTADTADPIEPPPSTAEHRRSILLLLFATGLATMGMEVIWIRLFTPYVGPVVYAFAKILAAYLLATFAGSQVYRFWSRHHDRENALQWVSLAPFAMLALLTSDPRLRMDVNLRVLLGVAPFAGMIGFLTPMLVDRWSAGDPNRAGRAYAINVVGCIAGPLLSGFFLLPLLGERKSMLVLALPWFAMAIPAFLPAPWGRLRVAPAASLLAAALAMFFVTLDYEKQYLTPPIVLRDSTATVIAGGIGMNKSLLVNGYGMTKLTQVTKMMAHLTLGSLPAPPRNVLVICFGMGTTFRSVIAWGVPATAVELVPSVPKLFSYFHADGDQVLASPLAHVVIDDGRRYLERSPEQYDAIIIDPPPPIEAAGSSLLYSRDFYLVARQRLRPGGILQQWVYGGDKADLSAATRALKEVFPYVNVYFDADRRTQNQNSTQPDRAFYGTSGIHYLASMSPIPERSAQDLLDRMPSSAVIDMMEWDPEKTPLDQLQSILSRPASLADLVSLSPGVPTLDDDRPINEYNQLRILFPGYPILQIPHTVVR
jgi:spermidine synthase